MQLIRMFSTEKYKGTKGYFETQKKYEILRTVIYFAISLSLFAAGWIQTGNRENLLTVVAVLGCLPASKSAVGMILYLRYKGCSSDAAENISSHAEGLAGMFDLVFTSYDKTYQVAHLTVCGNTICGYTEDEKFDEQAFYKHLDGILKKDNFKDTSVKIFRDLKKYTERLEQMKSLEENDTLTAGIIETLKCISL